MHKQTLIVNDSQDPGCTSCCMRHLFDVGHERSVLTMLQEQDREAATPDDVQQPVLLVVTDEGPVLN